MSSIMNVVISCLGGEKAIARESRFYYTFLVNDFANKVQIKNALSLIYGESVTKLNVMRCKEKVNLRKRQSPVALTSRPSRFKKAIAFFGGKQIDVSGTRF
ncbi:50S ribosomal protein L23 [Candidatus Gromoviella agglomerans]|uniref:50S ribosomal protein L23 n=1 Tax=Candidatus Gromoviella agglomerans TaxID=2806609 RepID=UPI001E5B82A4|nr:50S ribosomal protein L23 [Candidatus Gromoviella agglomerans]UFX98561.1 50S ribosomal protein L23 [Candidatus Gromoviella agglomerans]